jgi:hypothetical protein
MDKIKDNATVIIALVVLLLFMTFMFIHNQETKKINLIREDLYNDSIIMDEHKDIKTKDSQIDIKQQYIQNIIDGHEKRLRRLEKWQNTNKPTIWHPENQ